MCFKHGRECLCLTFTAVLQMCYLTFVEREQESKVFYKINICMYERQKRTNANVNDWILAFYVRREMNFKIDQNTNVNE